MATSLVRRSPSSVCDADFTIRCCNGDIKPPSVLGTETAHQYQRGLSRGFLTQSRELESFWISQPLRPTRRAFIISKADRFHSQDVCGILLRPDLHLRPSQLPGIHGPRQLPLCGVRHPPGTAVSRGPPDPSDPAGAADPPGMLRLSYGEDSEWRRSASNRTVCAAAAATFCCAGPSRAAVARGTRAHRARPNGAGSTNDRGGNESAHQSAIVLEVVALIMRRIAVA